MIEMTDHEILIAAKELIPDEAHWWRGGEARRSQDCHCPLTAIFYAGDIEIVSPSEQSKAICAFAVAAKITYIPDWADAPERTIQDIHEAFDVAIEATK